jgi:hypothetical protein
MKRGYIILAAASVAVALCAAGQAGASARVTSGSVVGASAGEQVAASPGFSAAYGSALVALSCSSGTACTAVGSFYSKSLLSLVPLAERWNGARWTIQRPPDPAGSMNTLMQSVACRSASACTAVGYYDAKSGQLAVVERWDGRRWTIQRTPRPAGSVSSALLGVSCPSAAECIAVGDDTTKSGVERALAQRWNGRDWAVQRPANPGGKYDTAFSWVSCLAATACVAVGDHGVTSTSQTMLAERWDGRRWSTQPTPAPAGAKDSDLSAVSCPAASACVAVGEYLSRTDASLPLAERWNGRRWSAQPAANPPGNLGTELAAVACPSASACTAVGDFTSSKGDEESLAEHWNGKRWSVQAAAAPPSGGTNGVLVGVRCTSAVSCAAVGSYDNSSDVGKTLAEHWNGKHWAVQHTPDPPS